MRAEDNMAAEMSFEEMEAWVEQNIKWEVQFVDRSRSTPGALAVVPVEARGYGSVGHAHEEISIAMPFIVLYGVAGEFPGLIGYNEDGDIFMVQGALYKINHLHNNRHTCTNTKPPQAHRHAGADGGRLFVLSVVQVVLNLLNEADARMRSPGHRSQ